MAIEIKFFKTVINNRRAMVCAKECPEGYMIYFMNDEFSDFINSYKTRGFAVKINDGESEVIPTGTLTKEEADKIWEDIGPRINNPDKYFLDPPIGEEI